MVRILRRGLCVDWDYEIFYIRVRNKNREQICQKKRLSEKIEEVLEQRS